MTIKQLRERLSVYPEDTLVVLSKDSEGNGFSPLSDDLSMGRYIEEHKWSGEFVLGGRKGKQALCLWPIN